MDDAPKLAETLEHAAQCFYAEQYGDTPLEWEMILFATRFAACQLTGYKTDEEEREVRAAFENLAIKSFPGLALARNAEDTAYLEAAMQGRWEIFESGFRAGSQPAAGPQWISPRTDLPDEDEIVLVCVEVESDDHDGVTQRWQEVHEATMYRGGCDLIASLADGAEYMNDEIAGWQKLPECVAPQKEKSAK